MNNEQLSILLRQYWQDHGPRLDEYLGYFKKLKWPDEVIRFACHGKNGKIHDHQFRVGSQKLEEARNVLLPHAKEIEACPSFDELLECVEERTKDIDRFGTLAIYDTSLRLGASLDRWPKVVYLHAGTRKGCNALGIETTNDTVSMNLLPLPIRELESHHAENFLCIFKDAFGGADQNVHGCSSKGRMPRAC